MIRKITHPQSVSKMSKKTKKLVEKSKKMAKCERKWGFMYNDIFFALHFFGSKLLVLSTEQSEFSDRLIQKLTQSREAAKITKPRGTSALSPRC